MSANHSSAEIQTSIFQFLNLSGLPQRRDTPPHWSIACPRECWKSRNSRWGNSPTAPDAFTGKGTGPTTSRPDTSAHCPFGRNVSTPSPAYQSVDSRRL